MNATLGLAGVVYRNVSRLLLAAILATVFSTCAIGSDAVADRYPPGSITSVETAERALADVGKERRAVEARFAEDELACSDRFFASSCHEEAKERRRSGLAALRDIENEANLYLRRERVRERDKALAEKREQEKVEQAQRRANGSTEHRAKPAKPIAAPRMPDPNQPDRVARHARKMKQLQAEQAAEAQKREENIAAYQKKVEEAQEHQNDVERRKAEKEQARSNRQNTAPPAQ